MVVSQIHGYICGLLHENGYVGGFWGLVVVRILFWVVVT